MRPIFRRMEAFDAEAVYRIEKRVFSKPWSRQSMVAAAVNKTMFFMVAELNGDIIGYCGMQYVMDEGEILNVAVLPEYSKQGFGEKLLKCFLAEAKKMKIRSIVLEVRVSNHGAIRLYEKLNFEKVGRRKDIYESPVEDGYIMAIYQ